LLERKVLTKTMRRRKMMMTTKKRTRKRRKKKKKKTDLQIEAQELNRLWIVSVLRKVDLQ
jgi:hypothetical protein